MLFVAMRKSKESNRKCANPKLFALILIGICVYLIMFLVFVDYWFSKSKGTSEKLTVMKVPYVIVHLDLKGAPPMLSYLKSLLPTFKAYGVNGLLMEYEDMFPYKEKLYNLSARNSYDRVELTNFLEAAAKLDFEIIPLVQTFGHMEHVLKLQEFSHLREVPESPQSICPTQPESHVVIEMMLEQVIMFHNKVASLKYIHVGCDEVTYINMCNYCVKTNTAIPRLFANHVNQVSQIVKDIDSNLTVLVWDDMFRSMEIVMKFNNVEVVYWDYKPHVFIPRASFANYNLAFDNIWGAAAFKGADGITATVPNLKDRIMNAFSWMKTMVYYKPSYKFKGLILTGWSRYNHMQPLCELLPVSLPSLLLSLRIIKQFQLGVTKTDYADIDVNKFASKYLTRDIGDITCNIGININFFNANSCNKFINTKLYGTLVDLSEVIINFNVDFYSNKNVYSSIEFYSHSQEIDTYSLKSNIEFFNNTLNNLLTIEAIIVNATKVYYDDYVISEYVGHKMFSIKQHIKHILEVLRYSKGNGVWERRPSKLHPSTDHLKEEKSLFKKGLGLLGL